MPYDRTDYRFSLKIYTAGDNDFVNVGRRGISFYWASLEKALQWQFRTGYPVNQFLIPSIQRIMSEPFGALSHALSPYYTEMSIMLMATVLAVYGDIINSHVKRILAPYHFVVRVSLFVLLCAFGYGALTLYGAPILQHLMAYLPWQYQGTGYIASFMLIGLLAERRRFI